MDQLLLVGLAGFAASLVDGALGMGFGPTSATILLSAGVAPAAASATVNIAKVAAGAASGVSHWRLRNIDRRLVARLAIPGAAGSLIGVTVLRNVDGAALRPWLAVMLLAVGARILYRFSRPLGREAVTQPGHLRGTELAGAAGGVTNGLIGAWGPVVTPFLLHRGVSARTTVGSVNTAEVAVAAVAAGSLLGSGHLDGATVVAMLIGGVAGAPIAAWLVRYLPPRAMGIAVATLLLLTNIRELAAWADVSGVRWFAYGSVLALASAAGLAPSLTSMRSPRLGVVEERADVVG